MSLLGPVQIRELAARLGVRPTKALGQNFVHDAGTVRRIVRDAGVEPGDLVLEVGPGLGSLTLALLEAGAFVSAVEIDPVLARELPSTIAMMMPEMAGRFAVLARDAMLVKAGDLAVPTDLDGSAGAEGAGFAPTHLVANLPYNVAVPVILTLLEELPSLRSVTVMVQLEVADRLAAQPGSRTYGVPSVKANWYGNVRRGAKISRNVFWPVPNVDSALVHLERHENVPHERSNDDFVGESDLLSKTGRYPDNLRELTFEIIDAAFAQRRKTLRAALGSWTGSPAKAEELLRAAGISPSLRGERLDIDEYVAIAKVAHTHPAIR